MLRVTLKNLLARKFRLVLTSLAVVLGVAFMAGTFVLTDTLGNVFDGLFADVNRGIDVAIRGEEPFDETAGGPGSVIVREPLDESLLPIVEDVEGVDVAEGSAQGSALVVSLDERGRPDEEIQGQAPTIGVTWGPNRELNRAVGGDGHPEVGRRPRAGDEVALDEVTAEKAGLTFGEVRRCASSDRCNSSRVQIVFNAHPPQIFRVVAIFQFGTAGNLAGATLSAFDIETAQRVLNREGKFDEIHVKADEGVTQVELRDRIRSVVRAEGIEGAEVLTGKQLADDQSDEIKQNLSFFNTFLLIFALIALFVGAFIIYNTFSIIVTQRTHELGLLRGLGASGRQVTTSVVVEALLMGLISSVIGLVAGVGVAIGLQELFRAIDIDLPQGDTVILSRTIVVSLLVGVLVTVVSALAPARRAARVPPVAAMHAGAFETTTGRRRYVMGGVLALLGLVLLVLGLYADVDGVPGGSAAVVGVAALLVFVGVGMVSPLAAGPAARVLGWLPARLRGVSGRLARENAIRSPRRTASTAAALMIGLTLVTAVAIMGASVKSTFKDVLQSDLKAEFLLSAENFFPFSPEAATAVREALPDAEITEFRFGMFELGNDTEALLGVDTNLGRSLDVHPEPGALRTFREDGGMLVFDEAFRELPKRQRTSRVMTVRFGATGEQDIPIAGLFTKKESVNNDYLLAMPDYEANYTDQIDAFIAVKLPAGLSPARAERLIDRALEDFPNVKAENQSEFLESQEAQVDQFLNLMYILLLLAVIIALIGIINTLALSIYERTHEIGLLRAVGMTRGQVRRMIRYEAVIIAVFGSALGIVLGLLFGIGLVQALENEGIFLSIPGGQLIFFLFLAGIAGLIAGVLPARRAARLDVLQAIHTN